MSGVLESRFRYFGTEASFEQLATVTVWQDKHTVFDISDQIATNAAMSLDDPALAKVAPELRNSFVSGFAPVHDVARLPKELYDIPGGHEGSHHFLADDFVRAVVDGTLPPINAWVAARYTLPGITAHQSAIQGGTRLSIPDYGNPPQTSDSVPLP